MFWCSNINTFSFNGSSYGVMEDKILPTDDIMEQHNDGIPKERLFECVKSDEVLMCWKQTNESQSTESEKAKDT